MEIQKEKIPMKNFKKYLLALAGVGLLIVVGCGITSCGGGSNGTTAVATPPVTNDSGLPPDPGEAGKATLAGIDSDKKYGRDDVQRYIALTYPDSEKVRMALTQVAVNLQDALIDANDKEKSIKHGVEADRAMECLWYVYGSVESSSEAEDSLFPVVLNTDERNKAYFTYDDQLGGEGFRSVPYDERASSCNFDVDTLSN